MKKFFLFFLLIVGFFGKSQFVQLVEANTGENLNFKKVENVPFVDGVVYRQKGLVKYEMVTDGEINVKYFGAKGDGITDDTNAIQKAFDFLFKQKTVKGYENSKFSTIKFPVGTYRITQTLKFPTGFNLEGVNRHLSKLFYDNRLGVAIEVRESLTSVNAYENLYFTEFKDISVVGSRFKNVGVYATEPDNSNNGFKLFQVLKVKFSGVEVAFFDGANILIDSCYYITLFDTYCRESRVGLETRATSLLAGHAVNTSVVIDNCEFRYNSIGLIFKNIYASVVTNSMIGANFGLVNGTVFNANLNSPHSQNSVALILEDASSVKITNNCIEAHSMTFWLKDSNDNMVKDNFVVPGDGFHFPADINPQSGTNYNVLTFCLPNSKYNQFITNQIIANAGIMMTNSVFNETSDKNYIEFLNRAAYNEFDQFFKVPFVDTSRVRIALKTL